MKWFCYIFITIFSTSGFENQTIGNDNFAERAKSCIQSACNSKIEREFKTFENNKLSKTDQKRINKILRKSNRLRRKELKEIRALKKKNLEKEINVRVDNITNLELLYYFIDETPDFQISADITSPSKDLVMEFSSSQLPNERKEALSALFTFFKSNEFYSRNTKAVEMFSFDQFKGVMVSFDEDQYVKDQLEIVRGALAKSKHVSIDALRKKVDILSSGVIYNSYPRNIANLIVISEAAKVYASILILEKGNLSSEYMEMLKAYYRDHLLTSVRNFSEIDFEKSYEKKAWKKHCDKSLSEGFLWSLPAKLNNERINFFKKQKSVFSQSITSIFPLVSNDFLEGVTKNFALFFPASSDEYYLMMLTSLKSRLSAIRSDLESMLFYSRLSGGVSRVTEAVCNSYIQRPLNDSASESSMKLSTFSLQFPAFGSSILFHEMGHLFSKNFKKKMIKGPSLDKMIDWREKISLTHPVIPEVEGSQYIIFEGDTHWTEEDWADEVSATVSKMNGNNENPMCAFLSIEKEYKEEDFKHTHDEHSPSLLRLINYELSLGHKLSSECKLIKDNI